VLSSQSFELLQNTSTLTWWDVRVRRNPDFKSLHRSGSYDQRDFVNSNYLFDDVLFLRISQLAKAGKIQSIQGNLSDPQFLNSVTQALSQKQLKISSLDISNAWWKTFMSNAQVANLLKEFSKVSQGKSLLIFSRGAGYRWNYEGLEFGHIQNPELVAAAIYKQGDSPRKEAAQLNSPKLLKIIETLLCDEVFKGNK